MKMGNPNSQMAILENEILNREKDRKRIKELKAWQKEAVPQLDSFKLMINEHEHIYPAVKKVIVGMLDNLIKQAEES